MNFTNDSTKIKCILLVIVKESSIISILMLTEDKEVEVSNNLKLSHNTENNFLL